MSIASFLSNLHYILKNANMKVNLMQIFNCLHGQKYAGVYFSLRNVMNCISRSLLRVSLLDVHFTLIKALTSINNYRHKDIGCIDLLILCYLDPKVVSFICQSFNIL